MPRVYSYPELLFIVLVNIVPPIAAAVTSHGFTDFLIRLVLGCAAGFVAWLIVIVLIVWPRFRH